MGIRHVDGSDIAAIASIFMSAFPESMSHYYPGKPAPAKPFRDIYAFWPLQNTAISWSMRSQVRCLAT